MRDVIYPDLIDFEFFGMQCSVPKYNANDGSYHEGTFWVLSEGPPLRKFGEFRLPSEHLLEKFSWTNTYPDISGVPCVPPYECTKELEDIMEKPKDPNDELLGFIENGDRMDPVVKQNITDKDGGQVTLITLCSDGASPGGMVLEFGYLFGKYYLEINATYIPIKTLIQMMEASGLKFDKINQDTVIGVVGVRNQKRRQELETYMSGKVPFYKLDYC